MVTGILVGLIESASNVNRTFYAGDLMISTLNKKTYIENSPGILDIINNQPGVAAVSPRYVGGGTLEANYQTLRKTDETSNTVSSIIAGIGSKIRMTINGSTREYLVKGILRTKADQIDMRVFVNDSLLRNLMGRYDYSVNEIAVKLKPGVDPVAVKQTLLAGADWPNSFARWWGYC